MTKLYFYYSAMNAGKTTILLQSAFNYKERGLDTLLFTPQFDNRFGSGRITSRIGLSHSAIPFTQDFDFYTFIALQRVQNPNLACVLVDEAQFLTKSQVLSLAKAVDELKVPALTYGLRTDFQGEPFEGSVYLLALSDKCIELKTICHCGRKATMTLRIDTNGNAVEKGEVVQIGGNESYVAVCRKHFSGKVPFRPSGLRTGQMIGRLDGDNEETPNENTQILQDITDKR